MRPHIGLQAGHCISMMEPRSPEGKHFLRTALREVSILSGSIKQAQEFAMRSLWTYNTEQTNIRASGIIPEPKLKMAA